jgi:hypothetical protein
LWLDWSTGLAKVFVTHLLLFHVNISTQIYMSERLMIKDIITLCKISIVWVSKHYCHNIVCYMFASSSLILKHYPHTNKQMNLHLDNQKGRSEWHVPVIYTDSMPYWWVRLGRLFRMALSLHKYILYWLMEGSFCAVSETWRRVYAFLMKKDVRAAENGKKVCICVVTIMIEGTCVGAIDGIIIKWNCFMTKTQDEANDFLSRPCWKKTTHACMWISSK